MQNMKVIINNHSMNILHQNKDIKDEYNCRNKYCLKVGNVCRQIQFTRESNLNPTQLQRQIYFGVAEKSFKDRFYNQTKSFTHEDYTNDTELSKEYWDIKRNNFTAKVTWNIVRECPPYSLSKRACYLCLNEKLEINHIKETTQ